jgi:hypothetical protein
MLKSLHDHFVVLYDAIAVTNPTLATDHALRQEEEVYKQTSKLTYRNVAHAPPHYRTAMTDLICRPSSRPSQLSNVGRFPIHRLTHL